MEFSVEKIKDIKEEAIELVQHNYEEIEKTKLGVDLNIDWDLYEKLNDMNKLIVVSVRNNKKLIGYSCYLLTFHPNYKDVLFGQNTVLYVTPEYRGRNTAFKLLEFCEDILKLKGAQFISAHVKPEVDYSPLLESIDYFKNETIYFKKI